MIFFLKIQIMPSLHITDEHSVWVVNNGLIPYQNIGISLYIKIILLALACRFWSCSFTVLVHLTAVYIGSLFITDS